MNVLDHDLLLHTVALIIVRHLLATAVRMDIAVVAAGALDAFLKIFGLDEPRIVIFLVPVDRIQVITDIRNESEASAKKDPAPDHSKGDPRSIPVVIHLQSLFAMLGVLPVSDILSLQSLLVILLYR